VEEIAASVPFIEGLPEIGDVAGIGQAPAAATEKRAVPLRMIQTSADLSDARTSVCC